MVAAPAAVEDRRPPPAVLRVVNPVMLRRLRSPLHRGLGNKLMIRTLQGRKTHRTIPVVIGRHQADSQLLVSASGAWRHNLRGGAPVRGTLDGVERTGHATLEEDPDQVVRIYPQLIETVGLDRAGDLGLRVNVKRLPTAAEIGPAVAQRAIVRGQLDGDLHLRSRDSADGYRRQLGVPRSAVRRSRGRGAEPTTAITTVAAFGALALGAMLFAPDVANPPSSSGPVPVWGLLAVIAAVVSGAASAALDRQPARRPFANSTRAAVLYVPGTWVLTSRWVYENRHTIESIDLGRLLRIESAFDIALIVAATAMAWALITERRDKRHP